MAGVNGRIAVPSRSGRKAKVPRHEQVLLAKAAANLAWPEPSGSRDDGLSGAHLGTPSPAASSLESTVGTLGRLGALEGVGPQGAPWLRPQRRLEVQAEGVGLGPGDCAGSSVQAEVNDVRYLRPPPSSQDRRTFEAGSG